jgi:FixJ family two-component response regulator
MGRMLCMYGYETELYASPEEFWNEILTTGAIGLIIDVELGEKSGIELARQLTNRGIKFPVIFMTAHDNEEVRKQARQVGCLDFLVKPFRGGELLEALAKSLPRTASA